jgi:hypothetical protein
MFVCDKRHISLYMEWQYKETGVNMLLSINEHRDKLGMQNRTRSIGTKVCLYLYS